jgi:hypothetical protein
VLISLKPITKVEGFFVSSKIKLVQMTLLRPILLLTLLTIASYAFSQQTKSVKDTETVIHGDTIQKAGITLCFYENTDAFSAITKQKMIDAFFKVYPQEMNRFNPDAATEVIFMIDSTYKGVAATSGRYVRFNPLWFSKHPEDIDVVTHEVMHIVQNYGQNKVPGWLTEGIADYARYKYGVNNLAAGWKLPDYKAGQSYTNAYRVTARFLVWVEQHKDPETINKLDKAMRTGTYTADTWKQLTGKTVDELWQDYSANPGIAL